MAITLPDTVRAECVASIRHYFEAERDEPIGDLQAGFLLDFVLAEIGPSVYNQALRDVQTHLQGAVADLDVALHAAEFGWSAERGGRR